MSSGYQTKFSWPISRKGDTTCRDNQRTDYDQWKVNDSTAQWYAATCLVEIYINSMEYLICFLVLSPMSVTKQEDVCLHFITKLKIYHLSYSVCAHDA